MAGGATRIGNRGEEAAVEWLRERGYYIVERNWRAGRYELDIIAQRWDTLHIIEVKTRHEGSWQSATESINEQKIRTLRRAAAMYRALHHLRLNIQFDLIAVTIDEHDQLHIDYTESIIY